MWVGSSIAARAAWLAAAVAAGLAALLLLPPLADRRGLWPDTPAVALLFAACGGALLYVALRHLLVQPVRQLTEQIAMLRTDPVGAPLRHGTLPALRAQNELATAARDLAALQAELRVAEWRAARLVALGTTLGKVGHDLRGILSPALLTAERLQMNPDASVKRAGDVLVRTVERATDLVRRTVEVAREAPLALPKGRLSLRAAAEDAAERARAAFPALAVENAVPDDIEIEADAASIVRVLGNLLRNAGEAGARRVRVVAAREPTELAITVSDDGPGLPEAVQAALFVPVGEDGGRGLGLALVRELMRAHGGDAALLESGGAGTRFSLTLPLRRARGAPASAGGAG